MNKSAIVLFGILLASGSCYAGSDQVRVIGTTLYLSGDIGEKMINDINKTNLRAINTVSINSHGGNISFASSISEMVRRFNMTVFVTEFCYSACTLILAAATHRIGSRNAKFLMHGAADGTMAASGGVETYPSNGVIKANIFMRHFYINHGVDPYFTEWAVQTPRENHERFLSGLEAVNVGLLTQLLD